MKKIVLVGFLAIGATLMMSFVNFNDEKEVKKEVTKQSEYEKGWEDGYCEGWKDVKGQYAICPITPICPIPEIDCSEGYKCGYNRGFKRGMKDARNN